MTSYLLDGFDHYGLPSPNDLGQQGAPWITTSGSGPMTLVNAAGVPRNGQFCAGSTNNGGATYPIIGSPTSGSFNFAMRAETINNSFFGVVNPGCGILGASSRLTIRSGSVAGTFGLYRFNTLIDTGTAPFIAQEWNAFEINYDNATGNYSWYINGQFQGSGTTTPIGVLTGFMIGAPNSTTFRVDDCYGRINDVAPLGDTVILLAEPITDVAGGNWTIVGGPTGHDILDNIPPDPAQYIEAANNGDISNFGLENVNANIAGVWGVALVHKSLKSSAGSGSMRLALINGASETLGADNPLTQSLVYYRDTFDLDPDTGAAWTPAGIAALEASFRRTA